MIKGLFITGTNTDVGKTYVTARIIKELNKRYQVAYYKAALSGIEIVDGKIISSDLKYVCDYANLKENSSKVSFIYQQAFSPHLASHYDKNFVDLNVIKKDLDDLSLNHDIIVVEGSGGIICPLKAEDELIMLSDVMKLTKYPLIIVTSATLGSINSAVLTALYAKSLKLEVLGFIINYFDKDNIIHQDNYKMIEKLSGYKVLGYLEKNGDEIKRFI